jgi:tetraacyldisaccharide 4'-kinase
VKAGVNILLMEYDKVMDVDYPLPSGNLREWKSGMKRAEIIVISKSPTILVPIERKRIIDHIEPLPHQHVYFTYYRYGDFTKITSRQNMMAMSSSYYLEKRFTILLVTGIASPAGMIEYLRRHTDKIEVLTFSDHHEYSLRDIKKIQETFDNIANANKIILTTEKDAMRLKNPELEEVIKNLPLFYLPIEVQFHPDVNREQINFDQYMTDYVRKNQPHRLVHQATN